VLLNIADSDRACLIAAVAGVAAAAAAAVCKLQIVLGSTYVRRTDFTAIINSYWSVRGP
jgi:hypothetical protein